MSGRSRTSRTSRLQLKKPGKKSTEISKFFSKENDAVAAPKPSLCESSPIKSSPRKRKIDDTVASVSVTQCPSPQNVPTKKELRSTPKADFTVPTTISKFFQTSPDDSTADFQTPKKKSRPAMRPKAVKRTVKKPPAKSKRAQLMDIRKAMKRNVTDQQFFNEMLVEHSTNECIDPDQLQMALAMSRSMFSESDVVCSEKTEFMSSDDRQLAYRETLKMFAYDGKRKPTEDYRLFGVPTAIGRGRRQKWAVVNTALTRRDTIKQGEKFKRKIDHILHVNASSSDGIFDEIMAPNLVTSPHLARYYFPHQPIYRKGSAQAELLIDDFYVGELCNKSVTKCGCLLKKWANIPGRDASPELKLRNLVASIGVTVELAEPAGGSSALPEPKLRNLESSVSVTVESSEPAAAACVPVFEKSADDIATHEQNDDGKDARTVNRSSRESSPDMFADFEEEYHNKSNDSFENLQITNKIVSEGSNGKAFEIIQNYSKCLGSERIDAFRDGEDGMNNKSSQVKSVVSTLGVVEIASSGKSDISAETNSPEPTRQPDENTEVICFEKNNSSEDSYTMDCTAHNQSKEATQNLNNSQSPKRKINLFAKFCLENCDDKFAQNGLQSSVILISDEETDFIVENKANAKSQDIFDHCSWKDQFETPIKETNIWLKSPQKIDCSTSGIKRLQYSPHKTPAHVCAEVKDQLSSPEIRSAKQHRDSNLCSETPTLIGKSSKSDNFNYRTDIGNKTSLLKSPTAKQTDTLSIDITDDEINDSVNTISEPTVVDVDDNYSDGNNSEYEFNYESHNSKNLKSMSSLSQNSQASIAISDDEINYSLHQSKKRFGRKPATTASNKSIGSSNSQSLENNSVNIDDYLERLLRTPQNTPNKSNNSLSSDSLKIIRSSDKVTSRALQISRRSTDKSDDEINRIKRNSINFDNEINKNKIYDPNLKHTSLSQESIVISDDEVNYSISRSRKKSTDYPPVASTSIDFDFADIDNLIENRSPSTAASNDDLCKIFDETMNESPNRKDEIDMMNESIGSLFGKSSRKTPKKSTNFRRTISDLSMVAATQCAKSSKYSEFLDISISHDIAPPAVQKLAINDDDFDEFDAMIYGHSFTQPNNDSVHELCNDNKSSATKERQQFEITHNGNTFSVKCGDAVSPKPNYYLMDSPTRALHLKKYGLKPLKRQKAVICLEHIYNRLHPFIQIDRTDSVEQCLLTQSGAKENGNQILSQSATVSRTPKKSSKSFGFNLSTTENVIYADSEFIEYNNDNQTFFLPSVPRSKKPWCLQPLHIAWYNLMKADPRLLQLVLEYRPFDLYEIKRFFKEIGLIYDTNDLIVFFDRQCITFQAENNRQHAKPSPQLSNELIK